MDKNVIEIYLSEIESQSLMALNAAGVLNKIGQKMDLGDYPGTNHESFRTIHSLLTHLSNISRLIWPPALTSKKKCSCHKPSSNGLLCDVCMAKARSATLLAVLDIQDEAHVIRNRTLRDHLEHFDERLDYWAQTSEHKNFIQDYIGPKEGIVGFAETDRMRQYDFCSGEFTFRGENYNLVVLFSGLKDILSRTVKALSEYRRF
ncbi:hypothetical protein [Pseudomonas sp. P97.38]|uniref:hypothetical protein n=1 Tax=Pseudomonas sp. P97.38 TaxID=255451 RepID=UPI000B2E009F|nr:hypothetical protein [Pseudomonas sp. P97.38]